jgi:hypothetical protein
MTVLLAGDGPDGISLIRLRPSVWTGGPEVLPASPLDSMPRRLGKARGGFPPRACAQTSSCLNLSYS